jgi:hypothetical protein
VINNDFTVVQEMLFDEINVLQIKSLFTFIV